LGRAERAGATRERADTRAREHPVHLVAERRRLRQNAERVSLQLAAMVFEEDENTHTSRFPARKSTIFSAAEPSSSIFSVSPRGGGSFSANTSVRDPASPSCAASTPRSEAPTTSCGFFFAPMIPFSDG